MEHVPVDTALEHARAAREGMTDELKAKTGDTLYPAVAEEPSDDDGPTKPAAAGETDPRDRLVPDPGDVKAATANPKFGEEGGATSPAAPTEHAVASEGDVHAPTAHKTLG